MIHLIEVRTFLRNTAEHFRGLRQFAPAVYADTAHDITDDLSADIAKIGAELLKACA